MAYRQISQLVPPIIQMFVRTVYSELSGSWYEWHLYEA